MWKKSRAGIKRLLRRSDKVNKTKPSSIKVNNNINTNESDMRNAFNNYFTSISHELEAKVPLLNSNSSEAYLPWYSSSIFLCPVTTYECCDIISKIKSSTQEINRVSGNLLESVSYIICQPLTELINCSFERGIFSKSQKLAYVTPLFTGGNKLELNN